MTTEGNHAATCRRVPTPGAPLLAAAVRCPANSKEADELTRLMADISARLGRVCAHLSDSEFADLVFEIAQVRMRYDERVYGQSAQSKTGRAD